MLLPDMLVQGTGLDLPIAVRTRLLLCVAVHPFSI